MTDLSVPVPVTTTDPPTVILDAEFVDLDALIAPEGLQCPPAVRPPCACGKDGTLRSHGGRTCVEVMELRAGIAADSRRGRVSSWCRPVLLAGAGLVAAAVVAAAVWLIVLVVAAVVAGVVAAVAWIATYWPVLVVAAVLLLGGGAKCAGLHCGGCRG